MILKKFTYGNRKKNISCLWKPVCLQKVKNLCSYTLNILRFFYTSLPTGVLDPSIEPLKSWYHDSLQKSCNKLPSSYLTASKYLIAPYMNRKTRYHGNILNNVQRWIYNSGLWGSARLKFELQRIIVSLYGDVPEYVIHSDGAGI